MDLRGAESCRLRLHYLGKSIDPRVILEGLFISLTTITALPLTQLDQKDVADALDKLSSLVTRPNDIYK